MFSSLEPWRGFLDYFSAGTNKFNFYKQHKNTVKPPFNESFESVYKGLIKGTSSGSLQSPLRDLGGSMS